MDEASINGNHADYVKMQNEWCFLPNNEKIKYHSVILYEIFSPEKFGKLIEGLDELYTNLNDFDKLRLKYKDALQNLEVGLFKGSILYLPYISDKQFEKQILLRHVFHSLGEYLNHISLSLHKVSASFAVLEIKAHLNDNVSNEINEIIYTYYDERRETIETANGKYDEIHSPEHIKIENISEIKSRVKNELINFLSIYFKGYFFELSETNISVIPSIDIYSLKYPNDDKIIEWGSEHRAFFHCFNSYISPHIYRDKHYLFCENDSNDESFNNFSVFANRDVEPDDMYPDINSYIEENLNTHSFILLSFIRWLEIKRQIVERFGLTLSEEIEDLTKSKIKNIIEKRKTIATESFNFERFKIEFNQMNTYGHSDFESLNERKDNLHETLMANIQNRIDNIGETINKLNEHSNAISNLKNIEYSINMQYIVSILTVIILCLTAIQIILYLKIPEVIVALFFS